MSGRTSPGVVSPIAGRADREARATSRDRVPEGDGPSRRRGRVRSTSRDPMTSRRLALAPGPAPGRRVPARARRHRPGACRTASGRPRCGPHRFGERTPRSGRGSSARGRRSRPSTGRPGRLPRTPRCRRRPVVHPPVGRSRRPARPRWLTSSWLARPRAWSGSPPARGEGEPADAHGRDGDGDQRPAGQVQTHQSSFDRVRCASASEGPELDWAIGTRRRPGCGARPHRLTRRRP